MTPFAAKRLERVELAHKRIARETSLPPPRPSLPPVEALKRATSDYQIAYRAGDLEGMARASRAQRSARYRVTRAAQGRPVETAVADLWVDVTPTKRRTAPPALRHRSPGELQAMGVEEFLQRHYRRAALANRNRLGVRHAR